MALSDNALTTLDTIKGELGIELADTSKDSQLERLINSASDFILRYIDRNLKKRTYTNEKHKGNNRQRLVLENRPVLSVASVALDDDTVSTDDYFVEDEKAGVLYKHDLWTIDEPIARRSVSSDTITHSQNYNIEVTYDAGYVLPQNEAETRTLPYDLEDVVINMVTAKYNQRFVKQSDGIQKYSISDESITFKDLAMSDENKTVLDRYKDVI